MIRIGLKVWSTNLNYIPIVRDLFARKIFDYVELFTVPGSMATIVHWKESQIPFVLHAPHSAAGLNPGDCSCKDANLELVAQVDAFFQSLSPEFVIFHPGVNGTVEESIKQFSQFGRRFPNMYEKTVIENKPKVGVNNEDCLGASVEEMRMLLQETGRGFCFDSTHAICYAQSAQLPWKNVLNDFLLLKPSMFHVCDGKYAPKDAHYHLGDGEFDLAYIIGMLPSSAVVSLETPKDSKDNLNDFIRDVDVFRRLRK